MPAVQGGGLSALLALAEWGTFEPAPIGPAAWNLWDALNADANIIASGAECIEWSNASGWMDQAEFWANCDGEWSERVNARALDFWAAVDSAGSAAELEVVEAAIEGAAADIDRPKDNIDTTAEDIAGDATRTSIGLGALAVVAVVAAWIIKR